MKVNNMILPNVQGAALPIVDASPTVRRSETRLVSPETFFAGVEVRSPDGIQGVVFANAAGVPNDHLWNGRKVGHGPWVAEKAKGQKPAYTPMAAYQPDAVSRHKGRTAQNVVALRGFWVDIEGSPEKFNKPGGEAGGYPDAKSALAAVGKFMRDVPALVPNYIVLTGSGGVHLHYTLSEPVTKEEWLKRAKVLVPLMVQHGLKIDAQCTTDAARIMRAPGSIHQKTGVTVTAYQCRAEPYELPEWDRITGYVAGATVGPEVLARFTGADLSINSDVEVIHPAFSYEQAAEHCPAMHQAALHGGRDTPYPVWILAVKTADLATEGRGYAHEISRGHADYDPESTDKKIDSLGGGPASCETWATAYGPGGPCEGCAYQGRIKNPPVQLGTVTDVTPPGEVATLEPESVADWVAELNLRFAVVRHGSKMVIVDMQTPCMTWRGVVYTVGFLDVAAFRQLLNGRFAPIQKAGDRPRPLADAWLAHTNRLQYVALVYAPGQVLPANMLNLWQGFAVEPMAGDVAPWLDVLAALVPDEADRRYVLRWLAWKIQNPGGVPDTLLIFKGAKGTGKNSLFDPLVLLFGRHAMLADDPELIAGRFTWHLMSLSFAVLDEAVFIGDPKQADRIKSRVTAKTMHYEQKGMDPVAGVNCCAYVMLTNHEYVWQATNDERRAVVLEVGEALRGNLDFWRRYHAWVAGPGPAALLHYLQGVDLTGFNPRQIPKGEALRLQVEQTALRTPAAAWWHQCLSEGVIRWRDGVDRVAYLQDAAETQIERSGLRLSYEQSAAARGRTTLAWAAVAKRVKEWAGPGGLRKVRARADVGREWREILPPLSQLREEFTKATQVQIRD